MNMNRVIITLVLACVTSAQSLAQTLSPLADITPSCKVGAVIVAPNGREIIATCPENKLRFFSVPDGKLRRTLDGGKTKLTVPAYSADGKRVAIASMQGEVRVYDAATGAIIKSLRPSSTQTFAVALSSNGRTLAVGPFESPVQLWNVDKSERIASLENPFSGTSALVFSPDDKVLSSADNDGVVRSYDAATGRILSRYDALLMENFSLAFSPDSRKLAIGGADRVAVVIDPFTGKELQRLPVQDDPIAAVALPGDGKTLVAFMFSANGGGVAKNTVAWNLNTEKATILASGTNFIGGGVLTDGRLMLATMDGTNVKLWSAVLPAK